jgi:hypothetical protein
MDYILGFALTFKSIFHYDFISMFIIGIPYMIFDGKQIWIEKITTCNLQEIIVYLTGN